MYGMAIWHKGRWFYRITRVNTRLWWWPLNATTFGPQEFATAFGCPHAKLELDKKYTDEDNWAGHGRLESVRQRWFFIAKDENGKKYKGEAVIDLSHD